MDVVEEHTKSAAVREEEGSRRRNDAINLKKPSAFHSFQELLLFQFQMGHNTSLRHKNVHY